MTGERNGPPGLFVLGMHRSGTSLVAALVDRLGVDGGPRASMLAPDEFNRDGYWEQRPIVEWHDSVLTRLGGWASAPPPPPDDSTLALVAGEVGDDLATILSRLFPGPWFIKDPRQCLLLGVWSHLRGNAELAIVVSRDPLEVVRSLQRRNSYPYALAVALWERHTRDLLIGLDGRPCLFLRYEQVTTEPEASVAALAGALDRHHGRAASGAADSTAAIALIRPPRARAATAPGELSAEQRHLDRLIVELGGYHPQFRRPEAIAALSPASVEILERRRSRLNYVRPFLAASSDLRARLDRMPARLRFRSSRHPDR